MKELRMKIRMLNSDYEDNLESLQTSYKNQLEELQSECSHEKTSKWKFELAEHGSIDANEDGVPYLHQECYDCGKLSIKLNDKVFRG